MLPRQLAPFEIGRCCASALRFGDLEFNRVSLGLTGIARGKVVGIERVSTSIVRLWESTPNSRRSNVQEV